MHLRFLLVVAAAGAVAPAPVPDDSARPLDARGPLPGGAVAQDGPTVQVAWRHQTDGAIRGSAAVSGDLVVFGSVDGSLRALARTDGTPRWRYDAGAPIVSTPAISQGTIAFTTRDNAVHAVDLTGRLRWRMPTGPNLPLPWGLEGWDYYTSSPTVAGAVVYVGSGDGTLYALELRTGTVRWRAATGGRIRGAPAVADGVVFVGSGDGYVYALDATTGERRWRTATQGVELDAARYGFDRRQIQGSPAVVDGVVYVGARDGALYALDARDGAVRWTQRDPADSTSWVVSRPAVTAAGLVVFGRSGSHTVHGVDAATGQSRWRHRATDLVLGSPVLVGNAAYLTDGRGVLWALAPTDGSVRWQVRLGTGSHATPVVADGRLFLGNDDGALYALDLAPAVAARAVYWDSTRVTRALFGRAPVHRLVTDELQTAGYAPLDAVGLATFLTERIADRRPSVVVFGMDDLPATLDVDTVRAALLRDYLAAAGKVVWVGAPPGLYRVGEAGRVVGLDPALPTALTRVPHDSATQDHYGLVRTEAGTAWGLRAGGTAELNVPATPEMTVLAHDERGRAAVWVRGFGGASGTGFVRVPPSVAVRQPDVVRALADYGVLTRPPR